ncbi:ACT domain-containing protein [Halonatronum saccharophilum]|uniref:ACT domain-containing protein n=1 Tax=Halonatronum saccharophilum TaxID=150060 RepID=UPI0004843BC2|nr:ACT domain-containing protein [Halonatronum saccharophilum]
MGEKFYIVGESILSEAMKKTVEVKNLLKSGQERQVKEAVKRVGLSRSAFYKYKDSIFPFNEEEKKELVTLSLLVVDRAGILSEILSTIANHRVSVLTINQDIPLDQVAHITVTIKVDKMSIPLEELLEQMKKIKGIRRVKVITKSFKSK